MLGLHKGLLCYIHAYSSFAFQFTGSGPFVDLVNPLQLVLLGLYLTSPDHLDLPRRKQAISCLISPFACLSRETQQDSFSTAGVQSLVLGVGLMWDCSGSGYASLDSLSGEQKLEDYRESCGSPSCAIPHEAAFDGVVLEPPFK